MVDAGPDIFIYSPLPAQLQRRFSVEEYVPNRCLDWSAIASVLILSVASRHWCLPRNVTVSDSDMGIVALGT